LPRVGGQQGDIGGRQLQKSCGKGATGVLGVWAGMVVHRVYAPLVWGSVAARTV